MKRLFLAIPVSDEIKSELKKQKEALNLPLKWIPGSNLHVTVRFLGNTELAVINSLSATFRKLSSSPPFTLELSSLLIKSGKFQHMLWAGFKKSPSFEKLATEVARTIDINDKKKPVPHINLVRSKVKIDSPKLPLALPSLELKVTQIELWESKLSPQGSTYFPLESFTLGGEKTNS